MEHGNFQLVMSTTRLVRPQRVSLMKTVVKAPALSCELELIFHIAGKSLVSPTAAATVMRCMDSSQIPSLAAF